jgi:hypothetical protein
VVVATGSSFDGVRGSSTTVDVRVAGRIDDPARRRSVLPPALPIAGAVGSSRRVTRNRGDRIDLVPA